MKFELNTYTRKLTDDEILNDILNVAQELKIDYLSISTYKKYGKFSQTAIQGHFGTWKRALNLAGLRSERKSCELKLIKDEEYFADIRRVSELIGKKLFLIANIKNMENIHLSIYFIDSVNGVVY